MDSIVRVLGRESNQDALLKAKLRSGHFQEWQVVALDRLGHHLFGDGNRKVNWSDWNSRKEFLEYLPDLLVKKFAIACAEHVLPIWTQEFPDDHRPAQAIQAAKDFLDGKITESELREKETAAWAAAKAGLVRALPGLPDMPPGLLMLLPMLLMLPMLLGGLLGLPPGLPMPVLLNLNGKSKN